MTNVYRPLTKGDLIRDLQALDCPDETPVVMSFDDAVMGDGVTCYPIEDAPGVQNVGVHSLRDDTPRVVVWPLHGFPDEPTTEPEA